MTHFFVAVRETVRTKLWPLPVAALVLAAVAGVLLPLLDAAIDESVPPWLSAALFGGDAGAARTLLDAIASSLITVTSLTFSLTVVTLQLASSQFSPRLLRTFTSDTFVQATLAIFLATFIYSLTVLRAVRGGDDDGAAFVPKVSVTVAFVLALISVFGLVLFLAHLARQIRVETMLRDVHEDADTTVRLVTKPRDDADSTRAIPSPPHDAAALTAPTSGFLTSIDGSEILSAATKYDAVVIVDCHPGSSLVQGVPIGKVWSDSGGLDRDDVDRLQAAVTRAIQVGYERTAVQDVGYGLRQLTDVANRALSPGINDPTTAVHALGHISALLCQLAGRDLGPVLLDDDDHRVRVVLRRPDLADYIEQGISQPRRYGSSDAQVMLRLFRLLEELAYHVDDAGPVRAQLRRLRETAATADYDLAEIAEFDEAAERVERALRSQRLDRLNPS